MFFHIHCFGAKLLLCLKSALLSSLCFYILGNFFFFNSPCFKYLSYIQHVVEISFVRLAENEFLKWVSEINLHILICFMLQLYGFRFFSYSSFSARCIYIYICIWKWVHIWVHSIWKWSDNVSYSVPSDSLRLHEL